MIKLFDKTSQINHSNPTKYQQGWCICQSCRGMTSADVKVE